MAVANQLDQRASVLPELGERLGEAAHLRREKAECTLLAFDRLSWGQAENRIAAAVLGDRACLLMRVIPQLQWSDPHGRGMLDEMERDAFDCAREAAHYALTALELEDVALATLNQVVR